MVEPVQLTDDQLKQHLRDIEIIKLLNKWLPERAAFHKKSSEWISTEALENLSDDDLRLRFIEYFDAGAGRHPFNRVYRDRIIRDVRNFRAMLHFLIDEILLDFSLSG